MAIAAPVAAPRAGLVFLYFTPLTLLVFLVIPNGMLLDVATSFMLKNQLQATPDQIANFRLLTAIPVYLSFCFGLARDLWNPFGLRDRGLMMIFGALTAALFVWIARAPLSYRGLLAGMLLVMFSFAFVGAAARGLMTLVSQEQLMSGRLSALWNAVSSAPYALGAFASGFLAEHLLPSRTFLLVAAISAAIALFGLWKPRAVFGHAYDQPLARGAGFVGDLKRLARHRAAYPAVLLVCVCQFSPGFNTPLQFYLTNDLHLPDAAYAYSQGLLRPPTSPPASCTPSSASGCRCGPCCGPRRCCGCRRPSRCSSSTRPRRRCGCRSRSASPAASRSRPSGTSRCAPRRPACRAR